MISSSLKISGVNIPINADKDVKSTETVAYSLKYINFNSALNSKCSSYASLYDISTTPLSSSRSTPLQFHMELNSPEPLEECKPNNLNNQITKPNNQTKPL